MRAIQKNSPLNLVLKQQLQIERCFNQIHYVADSLDLIGTLVRQVKTFH